MNRFLKGLSYGFSRNLGKNDRIIRTVIALAVLASWDFRAISVTVGIILGVFAIMILGTAASARCGVTYWMNACTIPEKEKAQLDAKGIKYE